MYKRFWVIAVFLFLFAQSFSLWHAAESGFERHQHHGKVCALYLHSEHQSFDTASTPVTKTVIANVVHISAAHPAFIFVGSQTCLANSPRAPPIFS